ALAGFRSVLRQGFRRKSSLHGVSGRRARKLDACVESAMRKVAESHGGACLERRVDHQHVTAPNLQAADFLAGFDWSLQRPGIHDYRDKLVALSAGNEQYDGGFAD